MNTVQKAYKEMSLTCLDNIFQLFKAITSNNNDNMLIVVVVQ